MRDYPLSPMVHGAEQQFETRLAAAEAKRVHNEQLLDKNTGCARRDKDTFPGGFFSARRAFPPRNP
jgi:hypothetical protein